MKRENFPTNTILFKNIPKQITNVEDLLKSLNIPAKQVKPFGRKRVLITYEDADKTEEALDTLKSLEINEKLCNVSLFTKEKINVNEKIVPKTKKILKINRLVQTLDYEYDQLNTAGENRKPPVTPVKINKYVRKLYAVEGNLGFDQPPPPYLKYNYPVINANILNAISVALINDTRFYTQVLHLMNRMNLEPPFNVAHRQSFHLAQEKATQTDLIVLERISRDDEELQESKKRRHLSDKEALTKLENSESELETSDDNRDKRTNQRLHREVLGKRKQNFDEELLKKKARRVLQTVRKQNKHLQKTKIASSSNTVEGFQAHQLPICSKKIEVNLKPTNLQDDPPSLDRINKKLTPEELQSLPIYEKYSKGLPSNKLYIKNLHKNVTASDLRIIYKEYITSDMELDIKVMQHGRMKGQAFVTFIEKQPTNLKEIIETALEATNGLLLQQKPMIRNVSAWYLGKQGTRIEELGLIQTIYVDGAQADNNNSSSKTSKSKLLQQTYDYVICVDFEATCWENQAPPRWRESEIIEFPAVLVNLKTGKIEAEFHKYIMPIESPKLSAFCTKLTGIAQKTVDNGIPLQTALMMFQEWLRKELRARHLSLPKMTKDNKLGNCAFVSWTDWDFGICLHKECSRKRLKKPPYFNQWIDLRAIYKKWYKYQPLNFADALRHVGLSFQGREHSGIDDAKNLAGLAYKLIKDGATLAITQDLTPFQLNLNCVL
uniref:Exonuclease domain-containing protein n=1 Tax=Glossina pallidipes TaxID=7398 RepID=A0A1A9Z5H2_GLOPL